jgi:cystathionine gamma-synthase
MSIRTVMTQLPVAKAAHCGRIPPRMPAFEHFPLGRPIPASPHAVSCSLPTMRAVRGYEEKDPAVLSRMEAGYPRFVVNPFARRLAEHLAKAAGLSGRKLWLTSSARMARSLCDRLHRQEPDCAAALFEAGSLHGVSHADAADASLRAKLFLQNVGGFLSSRQAEDHLVRLGLEPEARPETVFDGDPESEVRRHLLRALPGARGEDLFLANCGMNAIYAAFRAAASLQAARGRTLWIQLGWLYLDTIAILKKFTGAPADYAYFPDVFDLPALERFFAANGPRIAGLVTEIPTNPLIQTPDADAIARLCRRHGALLIIDPSIASAFSVEVLPLADIVVGSLTKYTASEGDVIAGFAAVNPGRPDAGGLGPAIRAELEPVYRRDLARLAAEIPETQAVLSRIEAAAPRVAAFLSSHPGVKEVYWALHPASREQYLKVARTPHSVGGMMAFTLRGKLETFYDALRLPKGPSFGMKTTLISPFMYLAHYDLVSTPAGRAELAASGLDPDLLRLCVGIEPVEEIIAARGEALTAAGP